MHLHRLPSPPTASRRPARGPSARILLVDPGSDAGLGLLLMFRIWGHTVTVARTWEDGLSQARALPPHLALVNLELLDCGLGRALAALQEAGYAADRLVAIEDGLPCLLEEGSFALRHVGTPTLKALAAALAARSRHADAATALGF